MEKTDNDSSENNGLPLKKEECGYFSRVDRFLFVGLVLILTGLFAYLIHIA